MRTLIVANIMSLDGYYEGPGGDVMALPMDHSFDAYNAERLASADTLLLGRRSYEAFKSFWPQMADSPDAGTTHREIGLRQNAMDKVVVSDGLTADQTRPWQDTTTIVRRGDAHEQVAAIKRSPGRDILVFGSRTLWNDLLAAGLVDEVHLMVGPVVLGGGTPAFGAVPGAPLRLQGVRRWEDSDNLVVRYACGAAPGGRA